MESYGDEKSDAGAAAGRLVEESTDGAGDESPAETESLYGPGVPTAELYAEDAPDPEWDGGPPTEPIFALTGQPDSDPTQPE